MFSRNLREAALPSVRSSVRCPSVHVSMIVLVRMAAGDSAASLASLRSARSAADIVIPSSQPSSLFQVPADATDADRRPVRNTPHAIQPTTARSTCRAVRPGRRPKQSQRVKSHPPTRSTDLPCRPSWPTTRAATTRPKPSADPIQTLAVRADRLPTKRNRKQHRKAHKSANFKSEEKLAPV